MPNLIGKPGLEKILYFDCGYVKPGWMPPFLAWIAWVFTRAIVIARNSSMTALGRYS
jgi:hypothetical protein